MIAPVLGEYWVEVDADVSISDLAGGPPSTVPGMLRMVYDVEEDGVVRVRSLISTMDDIELVMQIAWWEVPVESLRCTRLSNEAVIAGTLEGTQMELASGIVVRGRSFPTRDAEGECSGEVRWMRAESPTTLTAVHDPANDHFSFFGSFEGGEPGQQYKVTIEAEGGFLNRPPQAQWTAVAVDGAGAVDTAPDGCPATRTESDPPIVRRNTEKGLEVTLRSDSFDPDGVFPEGGKPKLPRVDIAFEQWVRTMPDGYSFVGGGREVGPLLFETGAVHEVLLWVRDRRGAESRQICRFEVIESGL